MMDAISIALVDLDGTMADYERQLLADLENIRGPDEPELTDIWKHAGDHISRRMDLIKGMPGWWENLPLIQAGMDVVDVMREQEWELHVLTKSPAKVPNAWTEKINWSNKYLPDAHPIITGNATEIAEPGRTKKSLVYGKVLFDDYITFMADWLCVRSRGLGIMSVNEGNKRFKHPNVVMYDGTNLDEVRRALEIAKNREPGEPLEL